MEPKVSVKEILARFENLTEKTDTTVTQVNSGVGVWCGRGCRGVVPPVCLRLMRTTGLRGSDLVRS